MRKIKLLYYLFLILHIKKVVGENNINLHDNSQQQTNNTQQLINKSIVNGIHDPDLKKIIKSALGNDSLAEVVVKKNLMLFPLNAPNLVLTHKQEVHKIPKAPENEKTKKQNSTYSEIAEVNEFTLSALIPLNQTIKSNGTETLKESNDQILHMPKELKVIKLPNDFLTEGIPLSESIGKNILDSKGLFLSKRSISNNNLDSQIKSNLYGNFDNKDLKKVDESSLIETIASRSKKVCCSNQNERFNLLQGTLKIDSNGLENKNTKDMDTAEDIVFRPLFRYRMETRLRHQNTYNKGYSRRSKYRNPNWYYNNNYNYK